MEVTTRGENRPLRRGAVKEGTAEWGCESPKLRTRKLRREQKARKNCGDRRKMDRQTIAKHPYREDVKKKRPGTCARARHYRELAKLLRPSKGRLRPQPKYWSASTYRERKSVGVMSYYMMIRWTLEVGYHITWGCQCRERTLKCVKTNKLNRSGI